MQIFLLFLFIFSRHSRRCNTTNEQLVKQLNLCKKNRNLECMVAIICNELFVKRLAQSFHLNIRTSWELQEAQQFAKKSTVF